MVKVNLLFVVTKLELGGAQKQLLELVRFLDKERFNLFLFTAQEGLLVEEAAGIKGLTLKKSKSLERSINPLKDIVAFWEIFWFIKSKRISVVHTHSSKAGILGRLAAELAGVKYILHTVHGWPFHQHQDRFRKNLFLCLERFATKFTDIIAVVSDWDKEKGLQNRVGVASSYRRIYYGIDYGNFTRRGSQEKIKQGLGLLPEDLVISNISCFKPQKAIADFVRVAHLICQRIPQAKFILIGDGVLRRKIEKLIRQLKLEKQVILFGWRRDIPQILSATDVYLLTSLWEGLPISVLEALAAACPVIATDTGGVREIIKEGENGFLVSPGDVEKIAQRLMILLQDSRLRKDMGQRARDSLSRNFYLPQAVNCQQKIYQNLIETKGAAYAS